MLYAVEQRFPRGIVGLSCLSCETPCALRFYRSGHGRLSQRQPVDGHRTHHRIALPPNNATPCGSAERGKRRFAGRWGAQRARGAAGAAHRRTRCPTSKPWTRRTPRLEPCAPPHSGLGRRRARARRVGVAPTRTEVEDGNREAGSPMTLCSRSSPLSNVTQSREIPSHHAAGRAGSAARGAAACPVRASVEHGQVEPPDPDLRASSGRTPGP